MSKSFLYLFAELEEASIPSSIEKMMREQGKMLRELFLTVKTLSTTVQTLISKVSFVLNFESLTGHQDSGYETVKKQVAELHEKADRVLDRLPDLMPRNSIPHYSTPLV